MQNSTKNSARSKIAAIVLAAILLLAGTLGAPQTSSSEVATLFGQSQPVYALSVNKVTARSNETNSNNIIGGQPTRLTWEGTVASDEQITTLRIAFPLGSAVAEDASVRITALQELNRRPCEYTETLSGEALDIVFTAPVESGLLIRVELNEYIFPSASGDYTFQTSYTTSDGALHQIEEQPAPISVVGVTATESIVNWLNGQGWVDAWNSVPFLRIFVNPQMAVSAFPSLFFGWLRSFGLVLIGFPLAIPIGLAFSFLRMSKVRILKLLAALYVNIIRGTPLFLQIYIAFFGLPLMGVRINEYILGCLVLAMNSSAYLAEIFRAGIQSIHRGQFEASASLGMSAPKTMFHVIIPQTIRRVIPTATSEFILLYKDTSLLAAVGVMEMMLLGRSLVANTGNMTPYVVAACYYLLVTLPLTKVISVFEAKLAASEGATSANDQDGTDKLKPAKKRVGLFTTTKVEVN